MTLRERTRELLFPLMITAIVSCVWILGSAQPLQDGGYRAYYPAPKPSLLEQAMAAARDEVPLPQSPEPLTATSVEDLDR